MKSYPHKRLFTSRRDAEYLEKAKRRDMRIEKIDPRSKHGVKNKWLPIIIAFGDIPGI